MKNTKMIYKIFSAMLFMAFCLTTVSVSAQNKTKEPMMKDCCMMKNGKMMQMKDGKMMPMDKDMKMANGTTCMKNGECIMKDGTKRMMKEGECMDMTGKLDKCAMMTKTTKHSTVTKTTNHHMAVVYTCPMHPEFTSNKPGKCPKCKMDLVKKK